MPGQTPARVRSGQRRHKVQLQQGVTTTDALGGRSEDWQSYDTEWAMITPQPTVVSEQSAVVTFMVGIRYRSDVVEKHQAGTQQRVVTDAYTLKVLAVVNPELRDRELQLHCAQAVV